MSSSEEKLPEYPKYTINMNKTNSISAKSISDDSEAQIIENNSKAELKRYEIYSILSIVFIGSNVSGYFTVRELKLD
ncbi:4546_t:CDS:2 [Diversispora eburnea]|uniref:4546_t:CDS:1 n=1 Tax=Diversispora eburnea TaxID=1213867 RepID=A0A9N8VZB4_9GLOM|nr:4546_t:CDS:2 [Diversispora eburnea]